jgi:hypothetical protein
MFDTTEVPQARSTDPLTSKLAAARVNTEAVRNAILNYLEANDFSDVWQISHGTGIKETTVSSQMRPLARKGLVHEVGMRPSEETGRERIVWALGPCEGDPLDQTPIVKRGRIKTSDRIQFKPFTPGEIEELNKKARYLDTFTELLNAAVLERVF